MLSNTVIQRIIDETHARFDDPIYDDYRATAFELFPAEMRALGESFARAGFVKWFKGELRRTANISEENPDAPEVQLDLLPGLPAPAYVNVGDWRTPKLKPFESCTLLDLDTAIGTRRAVYSRQGARIEDLQMKREWFLAHRRSADETVGTVVERLGGRSARKPGDGAQLQLPT